MRKLILASLFLSVLFFAVSATAVPKHDTFWSDWESGVFVSGGGSGWDGNGDYEGDWIPYPSGWWNQWFYDDPPDPERWKIIDYFIFVQPQEPGTTSEFDIAINWSSRDFPESGPDGPPPMQDDYIVRDIVFSGPVIDYQEISGQIIIPDYNPEWVSIDIMPLGPNGEPLVEGDSTGGFVVFEGDIWHECIPEPATICLLGLGGLLLHRRKK